MKKILFEDALILRFIKGARFLVRILPFRVSMAMGRLFGRLAWGLTKRRGVARKNLRSVFAAEKSPEEIEKIAKASFHQLGMCGIELLRCPQMDLAFTQKHLRVVGREKIETYQKSGKGIIFLTGHFGSWELLNIFSAILNYPMTALARVQKHPRSDAFLNQLRRSKGTEIIHKGMPVREILRALKTGRIVGLLSDQDGGKGGCFVPFFGRPSSYPKGAASFALRTKAPIVPAFIFREGRLGYRIELEDALLMPPEDVSDEEGEKYILSQFARVLEQKIRLAPNQWLWAHRRWKSSPDRRILVLSDGKAGHLNQSLAFCDGAEKGRLLDGCLAEHLHVKTVEVRFKSALSKKAHRLLQIVFGGRVPRPRFWAKKFLDPTSFHEIITSYADLVVSTGSSVAGVNLWIAKENVAKSAVIMNPCLSAGLFDAMIVPRHDGLGKKKGVYEVFGALTRMDSKDKVLEVERLSAEIGLDGKRKCVGFLVGGNTADVEFSPKLFEGSIRQTDEAARRLNACVLATTSRRTPEWADSEMKARFSEKFKCPFLVIANEKNREGAVSSILALSDAVVVTGESVSMVSEAIASEKPVIVILPFDRSKLKAKHKAFLYSMEREGRLCLVSEEALCDVIAAQLKGSSVEALSPMPDKEMLVQLARNLLR